MSEPDLADKIQSLSERVDALERKLVLVQAGAREQDSVAPSVRSTYMGGGSLSLRLNTIERSLHALAEEKAELNAAGAQLGIDLKSIDTRLDSMASQVVSVLEEEAKVRRSLRPLSLPASSCHAAPQPRPMEQKASWCKM